MGKDLQLFHNLNFVYVLRACVCVCVCVCVSVYIYTKFLQDGSSTFCQLIGIYSVYHYL
jgi:NhaP-type Na+/H+ or K+/H+ antiporter